DGMATVAVVQSSIGMVRSLRVAVGLSVWVVAQAASAQDAPAAEALFTAGLAEMQSGKFDSGCAKLAESYRLDPRAGTLFTTAECYAQGGMLASAVVRYKDYLRLFARMSPADQRGQRGREKIAGSAVAELSPKVPQLTLRFAATAPPSTQVSRNRTKVGRASLGLALPVDPGEHTIVVENGTARSETRITIAAGESREVILELPTSPSTAQSPSAAEIAPSTGTPQADSGHAGADHTLAYVLGGVGIAGVAVGSITGVMVLGKKSTVDEHCRGVQCDQTGLDAADSASTLGLISTVGFGIGAVGLGAATVLLLTGKTPANTAGLGATVSGAPGGARVSLQGAF
nr:hypothetical protein [Polyangiaceae bacterium]